MHTKPVIELKRISHNERLSEETNAYAADLWVDGRKWGEVSNAGHGGCDSVHLGPGLKWADLEALEARIKATFEPTVYDAGLGENATLEPDLESVCGAILTEWLIEKDLKRSMARTVLFIKADAKGIYELPIRKPWTLEQHVEAVTKKHPGCLILNKLPLAEALKLYRDAA